MKKLKLICGWATYLLLFGCTGPETYDAAVVRHDIESLLEEQVVAWNAGDIEGFMQGYWKSDSLRFTSGGDLTYGWQASLERYKRAYPDRAAMGALTFEIIAMDITSARTASVFGKFMLEREQDNPWGYFTLGLHKTDAGWRIVSDHTSSAPADAQQVTSGVYDHE